MLGPENGRKAGTSDEELEPDETVERGSCCAALGAWRGRRGRKRLRVWGTGLEESEDEDDAGDVEMGEGEREGST